MYNGTIGGFEIPENSNKVRSVQLKGFDMLSKTMFTFHTHFAAPERLFSELNVMEGDQLQSHFTSRVQTKELFLVFSPMKSIIYGALKMVFRTSAQMNSNVSLLLLLVRYLRSKNVSLSLNKASSLQKKGNIRIQEYSWLTTPILLLPHEVRTLYGSTS